MLEFLQESIMTKNKEKIEHKNTTADNPFGKMVGVDFKALPSIFKLHARNEIQNVFRLPHDSNAGFLTKKVE